MSFSAAVVWVKCTAGVFRPVSFKVCDHVEHSAFVRCYPHIENLCFDQSMQTCEVSNAIVWAWALSPHNLVLATVRTGRVSALSGVCYSTMLHSGPSSTSPMHAV